MRSPREKFTSSSGRRASALLLACAPCCSSPLPPARRPTRCRPGTTAPPRRRSSSSCRRPPTRRARSSCRPSERIATFDQDGTLWVEQPMYTQVIYCLDRVPAVVKEKPELEERRAVQDRAVRRPRGDREAAAEDLEKILAATLTGMRWTSSTPRRRSGSRPPSDPRWNRPYTELTYQPMQEVLQYLRANGYKTYIVTGGGQDFVRVYCRSRSTASRPSRSSAPRAARSTATTRTASRSSPRSRSCCSTTTTPASPRAFT